MRGLRRAWTLAPISWRLALFGLLFSLAVIIILNTEGPGTEPLVRYFGERYGRFSLAASTIFWVFWFAVVVTGPVRIKPSRRIPPVGDIVLGQRDVNQTGLRQTRKAQIVFPPVPRLVYLIWVGLLTLAVLNLGSVVAQAYRYSFLDLNDVLYFIILSPSMGSVLVFLPSRWREAEALARQRDESADNEHAPREAGA
jgi:hypothetical protein